jgi:hypothetical protein
VHITASVESGGKSQSQHSQFGRSCSIVFSKIQLICQTRPCANAGVEFPRTASTAAGFDPGLRSLTKSLNNLGFSGIREDDPSLTFLDLCIVDTRDSSLHQALFVELPEFNAI